tara:strand:+ start:757 stop:1170 length:414 start_codon:yes stop_codon:yes gene_type:complete
MIFIKDTNKILMIDYIDNYIDNYVDNYVNRWYGNFLNKYIYVKELNNNILVCRFLQHESIVRINNNNEIKALLLRKPRSIVVEFENNDVINLLKDNYKSVYSKDLLDIYAKILDLKKIPNEVKRIIDEYIPEYGKLF